MVTHTQTHISKYWSRALCESAGQKGGGEIWPPPQNARTRVRILINETCEQASEIDESSGKSLTQPESLQMYKPVIFRLQAGEQVSSLGLRLQVCD